MKDTNAWLTYDEAQEKELESLTAAYKAFLDAGKTERECVALIVDAAEKAGYRNLEELKNGATVSEGDKVYAVCMNKTVAMFHIGSEDIENGMNILGAHIDSPRLDVKQNPLYEDSEVAYLDTHYYGGIKKYQWVTIPMAIHGVIVKADGTIAQVTVGESEDDPVVFVSDLLIHLAAEQMEKKARLVIEGENLDIVVGSRPMEDENEKASVKARILSVLKEKYDVEEDDLWSAELEIVPAGKARDAGLDCSMVMAYGQDDRVCAYTSLKAMIDTEKVTRTACTLLVDKEEIGSVGATGMQSRFFENTVAELLVLMGKTGDLALRRTLANSSMLSSDVSAAYDPLYAGKFDKKNAAWLGHGMVFNKFTGARGKSGSNDANAEYLARLRRVLHTKDVMFQSAELGKVDVGGGGTIAYIMSLYGMEVVDSGVAVLNMHAPYEVTSKADIYETWKGYCAFLEENDC